MNWWPRSVVTVQPAMAGTSPGRLESATVATAAARASFFCVTRSMAEPGGEQCGGEHGEGDETDAEQIQLLGHADGDARGAGGHPLALAAPDVEEVLASLGFQIHVLMGGQAAGRERRPYGRGLTARFPPQAAVRHGRGGDLQRRRFCVRGQRAQQQREYQQPPHHPLFPTGPGERPPAPAFPDC